MFIQHVGVLRMNLGNLIKTFAKINSGSSFFGAAAGCALLIPRATAPPPPAHNKRNYSGLVLINCGVAKVRERWPQKKFHKNLP